MSRKLNTSIVRNEVEEKSFKLIGEYIPKKKIIIECSTGHRDELWVHRLKLKNGCPICIKKLEIKNEVEAKGYQLLNEYENYHTVLELKCPNGHERNCKIESFRLYDCELCISEEKLRLLLNSVLSDGYEIITIPENTHGQLEAICRNGHYRKAKIFNFMNHNCPKCNDYRSHKYTYEEAKQLFESKDFELISTEYINCKEPLIYKCTCGEIGQTTLDTVNNSEKYSCDKCKGIYTSERMRGENHFAWNGGTSSVATYVRNHIGEWKKESMSANDYKCIVTQESFDDIHHLFSFNYIFEELKTILPYSYKEEISEYTYQELTILKNTALDLHKKYGYGVCLTGEIHKEFHDLYGRGNNDSFQFLTFVEDFYPHAYNRVEDFILEYC